MTDSSMPGAPPAQPSRTIALAQQPEPQPRPLRHLDQHELARRWNISPRTLERWRWQGEGPQFLKVGGRVAYRLEDIEAFEAKQLRRKSARTAAAARASREA